jgi:ADP-heptose:LPS heptosyltransferase
MTMLRLYKYYLTYIAAPINRLRRRAPADRSIFIAKFDGLGDFFLLLPHLKKLREAGYRLTLTGNGFQKEVLDHCGIDANVVPFDTQSFTGARSTLRAVRALRPGYAVNLSMSAWGGILVNQSRALVTAGLLQEREWYVYKGHNIFYDRTFSYDPSLHSGEVVRRCFADLLGVDHGKFFFDRPALKSDEIAVHPYGNWLPRRWPGFGELVGRLTKAGYRCALLGTAAEHASGDLAARCADTAGCRVVRLDSVTALLVELERCRAFIGNDSGPAHYAALIGKPTFVLWGPGNDERVRPLGDNVHIFKKEVPCRPCRQRGDVCARGENECLQQISVEEVTNKFGEIVKST